MPVLRYFFFVGGALLALLFISNSYLPNAPAADKTADAGEPGIDKSVIRIQSDRKWPERVVFDTSQPTIVPAQTQNRQAARPPGDASGAAAAIRVFRQQHLVRQTAHHAGRENLRRLWSEVSSAAVADALDLGVQELVAFVDARPYCKHR